MRWIPRSRFERLRRWNQDGGCAAIGYKGFKALTAPIDASNHWVDAVQAGVGPELTAGLRAWLAIQEHQISREIEAPLKQG